MPLLHIYPKHGSRNSHTTFTAALCTIAKLWKHKCPSDEQIYKMGSSHAIPYYSPSPPLPGERRLPSLCHAPQSPSCLRRGASSVSRTPVAELPPHQTGTARQRAGGGHARGRRTGHDPCRRRRPGASFSATCFTPTNTDEVRGSWEHGSKPTWSAEPQGSLWDSRLATQFRPRGLRSAQPRSPERADVRACGGGGGLTWRPRRRLNRKTLLGSRRPQGQPHTAHARTSRPGGG